MKLKDLVENQGRPYYTLAVKEDGVWVSEFGDYDRKAVKYEYETMRDSGVRRRVIKSADTQEAVQAALDELNNSTAPIRSRG